MFKLKMFLFAISIFVVFSCNKEKKPVWVPENLQEFGLNEPSQDLLAYITKEQGLDEEDIHINRQLLTLSMALKGVIFNESVSRNIILSAKETASNTVSVKEMLESNQIVNDVSIRFQNYANDYKKMNPAYRRASFTDVLSHIKYGKYEYLITIFVLNSDYLNPDLMPIFTSGLEINPNDDILGWKSNGAEIILSEENTKSIKNPIFIINLHPVNFNEIALGKMKALELNFKQKKNDEPEAITRISSHRYRDNMRYDWSGREEFSVTMAGFNGNAWTLYLKDYWTDGYKSWKKIDEIRKRDLEKNLYKWFVLDWHVNPPYWDRTFINYFERDWNYSEKFMGKGRSNDGSETLYLYGKTKYADHWLLLEPHTESGNNYIFPINVSHYSNGWLLQPSSWKMQVDWWRVDD